MRQKRRETYSPSPAAPRRRRESSVAMMQYPLITKKIGTPIQVRAVAMISV
jgi:hypothetical protein